MTTVLLTRNSAAVFMALMNIGVLSSEIVPRMPKRFVVTPVGELAATVAAPWIENDAMLDDVIEEAQSWFKQDSVLSDATTLLKTYGYMVIVQ